MRQLNATLANLARHRRTWERLAATGAAAAPKARSGPTRLVEVTGFGSNPGALRMFAYVPKQLASAPGLVVVLHGCTQDAEGYDAGSGWSTLADAHGFVLVFPEQQAANNPKTCFSWFQSGDTSRGRGEALSIRQMTEHAIGQHGVDREKVFVTGLSAGGAMAAAMLAAYPDLYRAGGIIAGLPYGSAGTVQEAFESMFQGRARPARAWGDLVRAASPHRGPWPRISVWHGSADTTVVPSNADEVVKQWLDVHGLAGAAPVNGRLSGHALQAWSDAGGRVVVESITVSGMAHGTPLAVDHPDLPHGKVGPYFLEAGVASSYHIARFFGLTGEPMARGEEPATGWREAAAERPSAQRPSAGTATGGAFATEVAPDKAFPDEAFSARPSSAKSSSAKRSEPRGAHPGAGEDGVQGVINRALRAAGLLKG